MLKILFLSVAFCAISSTTGASGAKPSAKPVAVKSTSKPSTKPVASSVVPAALPICLYGSGCRSKADCISGSKCVSSSPTYSQCVPDTSSELKSNCVANYAPGCGHGSVCCNSGFSCSADTLSCVPVPAPLYCSNTLQLAAPVVEKFTLILTRKVLPGSTKSQIAVNGTVPGPAIHITQGHIAEITVINQINNESTTIHWHGMFQNKTAFYDGVPELTQCVIPSNAGQNKVMVYRFMPNPAGTFMYHGHFNVQYPDGLYGPFIIHPTTPSPVQMKETDKWTLMSADWYEVPALSLVPDYLSPASGGDEPTPDAFVVNNKFDMNYFISASLTSGPVLVRLINIAALSMYKFSVDGLPLQIVEVDGSPVDPLEVPYVSLNVAQRVAFYLDFSKLNKAAVHNSDSIYFRVEGIPEMYPTYNASNTATLGIIGSTTGKALNMLWRGVINFKVAGALPTYTTPLSSLLPPPLDSNLLQAKPTAAFAQVAPKPTHYMDVLIEFYADAAGVNLPHINGFNYLRKISYNANPLTKQYLSAKGGPFMYPRLVGNKIQGSGAEPSVIPYGAVVEIFYNNTDGGAHPFHLHGHNFWVIATSDFPEAEVLYANNYLYRDVVSIPAQGWAKIRFIANNPGVWYHHCHIDWHMTAGLNSIVIEAPFQMMAGYASGVTRFPAALSQTCAYDKLHISTTLGSDGPTVSASISVSGSDQMIIIIASAVGASVLALIVFLYFYYYHMRSVKQAEISLSTIVLEENSPKEQEQDIQRMKSTDELLPNILIYKDKEVMIGNPSA